MIKRKGQMPMVGALITILVATIVGVSVAIPIIQEQITAASSTTAYTQTAVTPTNGSTTTLSAPDLIEGTFQAVNSTSGEVVPSANYTLNLATSGASAGTVQWSFVGTNVTGGPTAGTVNLTYTAYDATYMKQRAGVTILNLVPLFLALIILLAAIAMLKF